MSSRHTTSFTTHPGYRAKREVRNRLERLREEAEVTASCFESVDDREAELWAQVVRETDALIDRIDAEIESMIQQGSSEQHG